MVQEYRKDGFVISTDPARIDLDKVHAMLSSAYWSEGIPREIVERAIKHSLCFGIYADKEQVGIARVITDYTTYAYLCDVFIAEEFRGAGLGKWLVECIMAHPDLQGLRRFSLLTRDAHELYRRFGFSELKDPGRYMEIARPGMYKKHE